MVKIHGIRKYADRKSKLMEDKNGMIKQIKPFIPSGILNYINSYRKQKWIRELNKLQPISLSELKEFLTTQMKIEKGDSLFIHSGRTNLKVNARVKEILELLFDVTGVNGNILMPFYPIKSSYEWLKDDNIFDLRTNITNMGALPAALAGVKGSKKSIHPTKSVIVYGKDRDEIISEHHLSIMPYGEKSPYYKLTQLEKGKIIGLGVHAKYLSCMHVAVDIMEDYPIQPYYPKLMEGRVKDYDGNEILVKTYAHNPSITSKENVPKFLNSTKCKTYKEYEFKKRVFFSVNGKDLVKHTIEQAKKGKTFFYPKSLNYNQQKREIFQ